MSLQQAIIHKALTNGAVFGGVTDVTVEEITQRATEAVAEVFSAADIQMVNVELTTLSELELDALCSDNANAQVNVSELTRRLLDIAFTHL